MGREWGSSGKISVNSHVLGNENTGGWVLKARESKPGGLVLSTNKRKLLPLVLINSSIGTEPWGVMSKSEGRGATFDLVFFAFERFMWPELQSLRKFQSSRI